MFSYMLFQIPLIITYVRRMSTNTIRKMLYWYLNIKVFNLRTKYILII